MLWNCFTDEQAACAPVKIIYHPNEERALLNIVCMHVMTCSPFLFLFYLRVRSFEYTISSVWRLSVVKYSQYISKLKVHTSKYIVSSNWRTSTVKYTEYLLIYCIIPLKNKHSSDIYLYIYFSCEWGLWNILYNRLPEMRVKYSKF